MLIKTNHKIHFPTVGWMTSLMSKVHVCIGAKHVFYDRSILEPSCPPEGTQRRFEKDTEVFRHKHPCGFNTLDFPGEWILYLHRIVGSSEGFYYDPCLYSYLRPLIISLSLQTNNGAKLSKHQSNSIIFITLFLWRHEKRWIQQMKCTNVL